MASRLLLSEFFQHLHFAIGLHQRLPPSLDFHCDRLSLLIGSLPLGLEKHFIPSRIQHSIDVDSAWPVDRLRVRAQHRQFIVQFSNSGDDEVFGALGFHKLLPALVAHISAQP